MQRQSGANPSWQARVLVTLIVGLLGAIFFFALPSFRPSKGLVAFAGLCVAFGAALRYYLGSWEQEQDGSFLRWVISGALAGGLVASAVIALMAVSRWYLLYGAVVGAAIVCLGWLYLRIMGEPGA
jgi:hypothetical protein